MAFNSFKFPFLITLENLIREIETTEQDFQELLLYKPWQSKKDYEKKKMYFELKLGKLYRDLMNLVKKQGLKRIDKCNGFWTFMLDDEK